MIAKNYGVKEQHIGDLILIKNVDDELYEELRQVIIQHGYGQESVVSYNEKLSFKDLQIIPSKYQVFVKGREVTMTAKEFQILTLLARNKGKVFTKEQIYNQVWENDYICDGGNIAAYVNKIRKKIEPDPSNPIYLHTVWGIGYKFDEQVR